VSYSGYLQGLGQTPGSSTSLPAGSALIVRLQTLLMQAGLLNIHTADGIISSSSSATLVAIRAWATAHGMPTTGVARTSGGGLSIPTALLNGILGTSSTTGPSTTTADGSSKGSSPTPSAVLPSPDMVSGGTTSSGLPSWVPWVGGGVALLVIGAALLSRR
jgi:hypothetical protein